MHSKWQIWDYFASAPKDYLKSFNGILFLSTFDSVCLKLVKEHLLAGTRDKTVHHKIAFDVTSNWIEEEFQTLSFFSSSDCFFIHQAQELKFEILEQLISLDLSNRFIILSFETESPLWKRIIKDFRIQTLTIEPPRFWEFNKLLDFVISLFKVPLSYDSKNWILESLENDLPTFFNAAQMIQLNFPNEKDIKVTHLQDIFSQERVDQFALASLFCRKKFPDFFQRLLQVEGDFDRTRSVCSFMQSHLIKIMDPSYLGQKPRLTNYDKEIQACSKIWNQKELATEIERFSAWEIDSKKKNDFLWAKLKASYLATLR